MKTKLILILRGVNRGTNSKTIGNGLKWTTFLWSEEHNAYIWQGRELNPQEFNEVVDSVVDHNKDNWNFAITVKAVRPVEVVKEKSDNLAKARAALARKRAAKKQTP